MRSVMVAMASLCLCFVGCYYEAPLAEPSGIAIDPNLLGTWRLTIAGASSTEYAAEMIVLKRSEKEYLFHFPDEEKPEYHRGYPIKVAGISCIQIESLGDTADPKAPVKPDRFNVVTCDLKGDKLVVSLLDSRCLPQSAAKRNTEEFQREFAKKKDRRDLFVEIWRLQRQKPLTRR